MADISIRGIDGAAVVKLGEMARKKHMSRESYLRQQLEMLAMFGELKEIENKYENLVKDMAEIIKLTINKGSKDGIQEDMNVILKVKQEQNFRSEKKALQYIIKKYQEQEETEHLLLNIYEKIQEQRKPYEDRIKWAATVAEQNTIILLDVMNTILEQEFPEIDSLIPVDVYESPVIAESRSIIKKKIQHFKQRKDYRESKKKNS